jgi:uncharacterized membrane protein YGL010W
MAGSGIFDLEKQFAFYGAYHSNKYNILIHLMFVWPILFTALILLAYTPPLAPQLPAMAALPYHEYMVLNYSFVFTAVYALYYIVLEPKSGSLAALLVLLCWIGANAVAQHVPWVSGWKVVAIAQVVSWSAQFSGHGFFEGRAPALLDNLAQAFLMAPYFVLLEVLHTVFHFEPYPGFNKNVQNKVGANIAEYRSKKAKAKRME